MGTRRLSLPKRADHMTVQRRLPGRHRIPTPTARLLSAVLRPAAAVLVLALAAPLAGVPVSAEDALPWKDRFGVALPFQSDDAIIEFLRTAEITAVEDLDVGITDPRRVELVKDGITVRAALRDFDETFERMRFEREFYARLRDSYLFDLAAYELSRYFDLNKIPPVTLRVVNGVEASLQIWVEDAMVEWDRFEENIEPPDLMQFQQQRQNMLVFDSVIGNVDRNNGNILYDANWHHWLIDHSRSFLRDSTKMPYLEQINWCSRTMYEKLKTLDRETLAALVTPPLEGPEIGAILRRRDKVIARLDELIAERGEDKVLF